MADDKDATKPSNEVSTWLSEIARSQKHYDKWYERCTKIRKKYRYEASTNARIRQYQMLWSNMETMKPSVYTKPPKGVVQQRWKDRDPVALAATEMLERGINFTLDANDFNTKLEQVRDDYLLYARGVARVKYKPEFDTVDREDGMPDDAAVDPSRDAKVEGEEALPEQILKFENCNLEYVQREDFVHAIARTWEELPWVAFRCFMTRDELKDRFEEKIANEIPLDAGPDRPNDDDRSGNAGSAPDDKATIWEIWDKSKNKVLWVAKGYKDVLEKGKPYLTLEGFYPCPKPAYGTLTNDSLEPVPDYVFYKDQCDEIDTLTARIASLSESLKLVGFYPAGPQGEGAPEIERAVQPGFENRMIAVKSWALFQEGGKGGAPIIFLPVEQVGAILEGCVKLRQQLIEDVYQIYGLSDIMRGDGKANETATAQSIKAQYGSVRIRERQNELARFCRDLCRIVGEILASQFNQDTLMKMANMKLPTQAELDAQSLAQKIAAMKQAAMQQAAQQAQMGAPQGQLAPPLGRHASAGDAAADGDAVIPGQPQPPQPAPQQGPPPTTIDAVMALLRDGMMRRFRIDIEVDSTIAGDESQERQDRSEFIEVTTKFVEAWGPIVQQQPIMAQLAGELLLFGTRAFRVGRSLEEVIEETVDKLDQQASQPKPPPPIPPEEQAKIQQAQIKAQAEAQKAQADVASTQVKAQSDQQAAQIDLAGKVMDSKHKAAEHAMEMQRMQAEHALEARNLQMKHAANERAHQLKLEQMEHAAKEAKKPKDDK